MVRELTISLDAMGGDIGPSVIIAGAEIAHVRHPEVRYLLFGDETQIRRALENSPRVADASTVIHTEVSISMDDKPSQALRRGRKTSSMWQAIYALRQGEAQAAVSAGNTGALMAMSKVILKMIPNIDRPALAAILPTTRGESIVLDCGATIGPDAKQLVQFAVMGEAYARVLFGIDRPSVGILNIGEEEMKGTEIVKDAAQALRTSNLPIKFHGFVEGDDIAKGTVDVVVTDGFTGNVALKTAEGTARLISSYLREAMSRTIFTKLGYFFAQTAFNMLRARLDPNVHNGGLFMGLNGLVVKSHGSADAAGIASAIDLAVDIASADLVTKITADLQRMDELREGVGTADTATQGEAAVS
ncbi:MAG: phosphate acyltransferase [Rhodobiaceae bacterium]|nr:MAG: phosphate acyltransferase [Rhodobiaceae bacterium]